MLFVGARIAPYVYEGGSSFNPRAPSVCNKRLLLDRFGDGSFALQIVGTAAAFFDFVVLLAHSTPVTGITHSVN
jgi:hypothetical protein